MNVQRGYVDRRVRFLLLSGALLAALLFLTAWVLPLADYADATFLGEDHGDYAGYRLAMIGDVNGDGYGDFLIGAYGNDDGGSLSGKAYLILGRATANWGQGFDLGNADASFIGENAYDSASHDVTGTGDVNGDFIQLPRTCERIAGYGSSPFVQYDGKGMYFLESVSGNGKSSSHWTLKVMPHATFKEDLKVEVKGLPGDVIVSNEKAFPMTLRIPVMQRANCAVYRLENAKRTRVKTSSPGITFSAKPGDYEILHQ